ncbi:MAG: class I SAM-dependent methyltransferase [Lewinellaceae bacterium]|nr:class I SAM-dependent methyltransferase [Lewinellaceae bacterium]
MPTIQTLLGNTDIYLIDQIMKGRYTPGESILDAGAGPGRNLHWFARQGFAVQGIDRDPQAVEQLRQNYLDVPAGHFQVASLDALPFPDEVFHHVICCAVLHFAENHDHHAQLFGELIRVLKPGGSLFVRVATDVGLADKMIPLGDGCFAMPDGTDRYLLTRPELDRLVAHHQLVWLEPFKTVLVDELRSMAVLVLGKG